MKSSNSLWTVSGRANAELVERRLAWNYTEPLYLIQLFLVGATLKGPIN